MEDSFLFLYGAVLISYILLKLRRKQVLDATQEHILSVIIIVGGMIAIVIPLSQPDVEDNIKILSIILAIIGVIVYFVIVKFRKTKASADAKPEQDLKTIESTNTAGQVTVKELPIKKSDVVVPYL
ncbi:MAG: hypothetical protein ACREAW_01175, partial [Nitrososphaera sp.]